MSDFIAVSIALFLAMIVVFAFIVTAWASVDYLDCSGFERGTGIKTRWSFGCYAEVNGKWVPKQYAFGDAHEVRVK
jgi:hypothetical protein